MLNLPQCKLGESPRWDGTQWWWVDAEVGTVWRGTQLDSYSDIRAERFWSPGGRISAVQPSSDGIVVVAANDLVQLDATGSVTAELELPHAEGELFNDASVAPDGSLWVGTVAKDRSPNGALLHIDAAAKVQRFSTNSRLSNGMAWLSEEVFAHADSLAKTIVLREVSKLQAAADSPTLDMPKLAEHALPDGLALDSEGGLWVALYGTGEAHRICRGVHTDTVRIPTSQCTAVTLGGPDGRTLLITSAQEGLSAHDLNEDPFAGSLFVARVRIPGRASNLAKIVLRSTPDTY